MATTLKKVIESLQGKRIVMPIMEADDVSYYNEAELRVYIAYRNTSEHKLELTSTGEKLFVNFVSTEWKIVGKRVFKKRTVSNIIYAQGNKLKVKDVELASIYMYKILEMFEINWLPEQKYYVNRKIVKAPILKVIITGRIQDEETLFKRIASTLYKVKDIDWQTLKEYLHHPYLVTDISINNLKEFTANLNNSLRILIDAQDNFDKLQFLEKSIRLASILNRVIDLSWPEEKLKSVIDAMQDEINALTDFIDQRSKMISAMLETLKPQVTTPMEEVDLTF